VFWDGFIVIWLCMDSLDIFKRALLEKAKKVLIQYPIISSGRVI